MVQISLRVEPVGFGRFQHAKDCYTGIGSCLRIVKKPVLPAINNRADRVLNLIIADFYLSMVKECTKALSLVQGVGNSFLQFACRFEYGIKPGVVSVDNGFGKKLALFPALRVCQSFQLLFHFKQPTTVIQSLCRKRH